MRGSVGHGGCVHRGNNEILAPFFPSQLNFLRNDIISFTCVCVCALHGTYMDIREWPLEVASLRPPSESRDCAQALRLGNKHLYLLSHLPFSFASCP